MVLAYFVYIISYCVIYNVITLTYRYFNFDCSFNCRGILCSKINPNRDLQIGDVITTNFCLCFFTINKEKYIALETLFNLFELFFKTHAAMNWVYTRPPLLT